MLKSFLVLVPHVTYSLQITMYEINGRFTHSHSSTHSHGLAESHSQSLNQ